MLNRRTGQLLALSSLAICAEAKGRGGGGGTSGVGSSIDLGIGGKNLAILITSIIFALLFFSQFIRSFKLFSKRPYEEEIPLRKPFGALIVGATTSLTVFYAMRAVTATSSSPRWTDFPMSLFVVQLAFSKLVDIFSVGAVFLMINHRQRFFMQETCLYEMSGKQRLLYTILPIVYLVTMVATAAATTGLYARILLDNSFVSTPTTLKGYDATQHIFLAAYLLLVITIVFSAMRLLSEIRLQLAGSYPYNHANVSWHYRFPVDGLLTLLNRSLVASPK